MIYFVLGDDISLTKILVSQIESFTRTRNFRDYSYSYRIRTKCGDIFEFKYPEHQEIIFKPAKAALEAFLSFGKNTEVKENEKMV